MPQKQTIPTDNTIHYTQLNDLRAEFSSRGLTLLSPESLEIDEQIHEEVYHQEKQAWKNNEVITPNSIPAIQKVLRAPGLIKAVNKLLGEGWAIVPFTHNAPFCSGPLDQQWHKDDNGPYNSRKMRHHQSIQLEMIYYPQDVTPEMGPTACIPYAHYWTFDHETNNDNFAGADHLDFNYLLSGMEHIHVNGPKSPYSREDIINRNTDHDIRMRHAIKNTGWPLVKPFEAAPVRAGSVLLYSHNTFHRGNHRRDHWDNWEKNPRFMWRFYLYRVTDPHEEATTDQPWAQTTYDKLTETTLPHDDSNLTSIWQYQYEWLHNGGFAQSQAQLKTWSLEQREKEAARLYQQICTKYDSGEAKRIGAAYQLATLGHEQIAIHYLEKALYAERENIRRAATYGFAALGEIARERIEKAARTPQKWVRKAALFILGETASLDTTILELLQDRLNNEDSVYVRSVCASSLGCIARRAIAQKKNTEFIPQVISILLDQLDKEENRIAMNIAQNRGIKYTRPTDDCDVCEGNAVTFGLNQFKEHRSNTRENILWSLVMLSSHGADIIGNSLKRLITSLEHVIKNDTNIISYGFALDALHRIARRHSQQKHPIVEDLQIRLVKIRKDVPILCTESLLRTIDE